MRSDRTKYRYDDRDRLIRVVNARSPGPTLLRRYEFWGGLDEIEFYPTEADAITGTSPVRTISYEYDLEGNLVSASDDDTALGISGPLFTTSPVSGYDEHNRLRERTLHYVPTHDVTLTATYNQFGERTQLDITQDTETLTHSWTYDALGRLDEASFPGSGLMDFTPLPDDTIGTIERASGVITDRVYHARGPVDTITVTAPGSAQLLALDYTLNAVQNITGLDEQYWSTDPDEPYVFGYDGANRLASADYPAAYDLPADASYEYDPAGNRETFGTPGDYDYDANNRLTVSPLAALHCFDDDGNLVTKRTGVDCSTGTVTDTFTWDAQNRLRTFSNAGASAAYAYDPFGRRIKKAVGSTTTWYVWDGDQLLAEYDASGDRDVRYAYAGGFAPVQVAYESGSYAGVYDVHGDHLDTPRLLTDENGTPVWRASYEAFGEAHVSDDPDGLVMTPDPNIDFNVRFPGQYYDAETERWDPTLNGGAGDVVEGSGLHYNRFRTYDPAAGRYVSADPIGQTGGINVYRYVYANPLLLGDPLGLTCMTTYDCTLAKGGDNAKALADAAEAVVNTTTVIGFGVGGGLQTLDKSSEDCPPAREAERTKDGRGDVKAGDEISFEDAVDRVKGGEDVIAKDQETARDIAEAAGEGRPEWDPPHTDQAGPDARPHYHPTSGGERTGGHVFY